MQRYAAVVGVPAESIAEYQRLHASAWPGVLAMIDACQIRNYSIFLRKLPDGKHYLFSYFEYHGTDFAADMAKMAADPETLRWWDVCKPLLTPLPDRAESEFWAGMEEVFHHG